MHGHMHVNPYDLSLYKVYVYIFVTSCVVDGPMITFLCVNFDKLTNV
jgi:hypothetical protein